MKSPFNSDEHFLTIAGIQKFATCPRQWGLVFVEDFWEDNYHTILGNVQHKRAHDETFLEMYPNKVIARSLNIISYELLIYGKTDVVEFRKSNNGIKINGHNGLYEVFPIEYKKGEGKSIEADKLQLCAQAICLEEMLHTIICKGSIYYKKNNKKVTILFNSELRNKVISIISEMHQYYSNLKVPEVKNFNYCNGCSLKEKCLPKVNTYSVYKYYQKFIKS